MEAREDQKVRGPLRRASDYLIAPAGGADPDEVGSLQGELCGIIDRTNLENLVRGSLLKTTGLMCIVWKSFKIVPLHMIGSDVLIRCIRPLYHLICISLL